MWDTWQFWALAAALFAGLTAVLGKAGIEDINADLGNLIRNFIIFLVVLVMVAAQDSWEPVNDVPMKSWVLMTLSALATAASSICLFRALKLGDAGQVVPVDKLSVVIAAFLGVAFLGEKLNVYDWTGIALITAGTIFVSLT
ncbi:EamA family transporter [Xanthobacter sp. AM11]|uniref:EamA family transporter n=1 Tax=Xanthobacter sp. AM11 TaxID=3380643 RepID=UPI0039BEE891